MSLEHTVPDCAACLHCVSYGPRGACCFSPQLPWNKLRAVFPGLNTNTARHYETECGPSGRFFEPIPPNVIRLSPAEQDKIIEAFRRGISRTKAIRPEAYIFPTHSGASPASRAPASRGNWITTMSFHIFRRNIMTIFSTDILAKITEMAKTSGDIAKFESQLKAAEDRITATEKTNDDQATDLQAIAKALTDGTMTAEATTAAIGATLEVTPVNAPAPDTTTGADA